MTVVHELKIDNERLHNLLIGRKKVEIRLNDRDYQTGDLLRFPDGLGNIPAYHYFEITHIHQGLGMTENYVALSVFNVNEFDF